ncbi:MAG: PIN domain-containing protein [Candidatus Eisenbacteria bacterium]|nr:PIN domain-containing protein [Candidatus Eisenbacteria bacterium]
MKHLRIYVDTSVFGGCLDPEFAEWSNALMDGFRTDRYALVVSDVTLAELADAPAPIRKLSAPLLEIAEELPVTSEALELLRAYESQEILAPRFRNDMLHIAVATVAEVDVLVSWNFRHIVRLDKIRRFNGANLQLGYKPLTIYSPREVAIHGQED